MRREVLTCSTTIEEALEDLEAMVPDCEVGNFSIEEIFDELGNSEGLGVVWTYEE